MVKSNPYVVLCAAMSIDGKIATSTGDSKLSSRADLISLHKLRSKHDAILIGKNTLISDDPLLTVRSVKGKNPLRIILDSTGSIPISSKIIQTSNSIPTLLAVSKKITKKNFLKLSKYPLDVVTLGDTSINPVILLKYLAKRGIRSVLIEGGSFVNWNFIKMNLIDELILTITPFVVGGTKSISLVGGTGFKYIKDSAKFKLVSTKVTKNEVTLRYLSR